MPLTNKEKKVLRQLQQDFNKITNSEGYHILNEISHLEEESKRIRKNIDTNTFPSMRANVKKIESSKQYRGGLSPEKDYDDLKTFQTPLERKLTQIQTNDAAIKKLQDKYIILEDEKKKVNQWFNKESIETLKNNYEKTFNSFPISPDTHKLFSNTKKFIYKEINPYSIRAKITNWFKRWFGKQDSHTLPVAEARPSESTLVPAAMTTANPIATATMILTTREVLTERPKDAEEFIDYPKADTLLHHLSTEHSVKNDDSFLLSMEHILEKQTHSPLSPIVSNIPPSKIEKTSQDGSPVHHL